MSSEIFDAIAVEAAAKEVLELWRRRDAWQNANVVERAEAVFKAKAVISAAIASLRERGMAQEAGALWKGDAVIAVTDVLSHPGYVPVVIIRLPRETA
jgi:erythromycin esterase-like protein